MRKIRIRRSDRPRYLIVFLIIVVAFLLLGGVEWAKGILGGGGLSGTANLQWIQIFIGLGVGFLLGFLAGRRR